MFFKDFCKRNYLDTDYTHEWVMSSFKDLVTLLRNNLLYESKYSFSFVFWVLVDKSPIFLVPLPHKTDNCTV